MYRKGGRKARVSICMYATRNIVIRFIIVTVIVKEKHTERRSMGRWLRGCKLVPLTNPIRSDNLSFLGIKLFFLKNERFKST